VLLALICSDWSIAHTDVPASAMSDKYVPEPDRHGDLTVASSRRWGTMRMPARYVRPVSQRTGIVNQIRAFLLEPGIAVQQGQPLPAGGATAHPGRTARCAFPPHGACHWGAGF
jgi:hypothetical protein